MTTLLSTSLDPFNFQGITVSSSKRLRLLTSCRIPNCNRHWMCRRRRRYRAAEAFSYCATFYDSMTRCQFQTRTHPHPVHWHSYPGVSAEQRETCPFLNVFYILGVFFCIFFRYFALRYLEEFTRKKKFCFYLLLWVKMGISVDMGVFFLVLGCWFAVRVRVDETL